MSVACFREVEIARMDDDKLAISTAAILTALARLRFELRLIACALALFLIAFIVHTLYIAAR